MSEEIAEGVKHEGCADCGTKRQKILRSRHIAGLECRALCDVCWDKRERGEKPPGVIR